MRKLTTTLFAGALAASFTGVSFVPAMAMPAMPAPAAENGVVNVQNFRWSPRDERRGGRDARGFYRQGNHYYLRGHRGYRDRRPGYRYHQGWWFPPAAFALGAIVGGAFSSQAPAYRGYGNAHVEWCFNRYRSYRVSDNTWQPYSGPRRQCMSPYS